MSAAEAQAVTEKRLDRRADRRKMREALYDISRLKRVTKCGKYAIDRSEGVSVRSSGEGAHFAGVQLCGSIWACPCCSAKIRQGRCEEISAAVRQHVDRGGLALFLTLTVMHGVNQRLADLFPVVADSWRAMNGGQAAKERRERYGITGFIRAIEVTHGENGWHPHLHVLVLLDVGRTVADVERLGDELVDVWCDTIGKAGMPRPSLRGQKAITVENAEGVAAYVSKVQDADSAAPIALELGRGDLKAARSGHRTPFQILRDFTVTGDLAERALWHEYEEVTRRRQCIAWSKGLRSLFELEDKTDEDINGEEVQGSTLVCKIPHKTWAAVSRRRGMGTELLEAAERRGVNGVRMLLAAAGLPIVLGLPPDDLPD